MNLLTGKLAAGRLLALMIKETREILRNKYLIFLILVPPVLQLLILGAAIDPQVRNLALAVVDQSRTADSAKLINQLASGRLFKVTDRKVNEKSLPSSLELGKDDVAIVIPGNFSGDLSRGKQSEIQILVDGSNAYVAGIASASLLNTISRFEPGRLAGEKRSGRKHSDDDPDLIQPRMHVLYNPHQYSSWSFLPGILGATLTLTGTLVSAATILRERESGTMEQLLMTPASTAEILIAKVLPLVIFLLADVCLAVYATNVIFAMPCRGNIFLLLAASALYIFVAIGLGMMLGSVYGTQRQAQLASFFINIPVILLSGTVVPLDTMPAFLQAVSWLDPLRYYAFLNNSIILKGDTFDMLWQPMTALAISALIVMIASSYRFGRQLI